ncbi:MAG: InlB B-repeat-containing protein, partial [Candidatus Methanomethylophilaceae archaeon]|nr:InlB B-repeat-containing protein [Candidatus Methanomethylophilaceae archaeon]
MHGCGNDILYNGVIRGTRIHFVDSEKRLKKRMIFGSILLLFVISIIAVIFVVDICDDSSASYPSASEVYVDDNLHFTESELYYNGVFITGDPTNAVASYDPDTGTLTLNGYHSGGIGSTSDSGLVVKLVGNNAISSGKIVDSNTIGVYAKNDLLFNSESNSSLDITLNGNSQFGIYAEGNVIIDSNITISCKIFSNDIAYGIYSENNITLSNSSKLLIETMGSEQYGCYGKGSLNLNDSVLGIELGAKNNATGDGIFLEKSYSNSGSITFSNSKVSVITGSSSSRFNAITTNGGLDKTAIIDINLTQLSINGGFNCGIRNFSQFGTTNDIQIDSSTITIGSSSYKLITGIQSANNGIFLENVNLVLYAVKGIDLYTAKSNVKISIIGISTLELTSEMPFLTVRSDNSTLIDLSEGGYVLLNSVNSLGRVDLGSKTTIENISSYETTGDNSNLEYLLSESGLIKFIYGSNTTPASQVELIGTLLIISYISDGRNIFQPKIVEYGKIAEMPNEVIKPGYVFEGWYTNEEFTSLWDHELPITSNLTLYAKWSPIQY